VQGAFGIATVDLIAGEATLPKRKEKDEATEAHVKLMSSSCQSGWLLRNWEEGWKGKAMLLSIYL
jgi:hypothetical protein